MDALRLSLFTTLAMIAFASNSLLCRAALRDTQIDAASFTFIRIVAGAIALLAIVFVRDGFSSPVTRPSSPTAGNWVSALALVAYAAAFSFAYNTLPAGTGALLLFGAVQATMILWGFGKGERLDLIQVVGLLVAVAGLVVLVFPGIHAPPVVGSVLMITAGIAWGIYSLRGRTAGDAVTATAGNFMRGVPFALIISLIAFRSLRIDSLGLTYAVISGAMTSGLGYVLWYAALSEMRATSAATIQLSVPVIAATGGILLLNEPISLRYVVASVAILGGIFAVVIEKKSRSKDQQ